MNTFWSVVIGVSAGILLFFLCLLVKFCCCNGRNRQNYNKEDSESGLQGTKIPLLQRDHQFVGSSQFNVEREFRRDESRAVPKKPVPTKVVPKKAVPKKAIPKKAVPKEAVTKNTIPKKPVPKKAVPKKAVPNKTVPKKVLQVENQDKHRTKKSKALSFPKPQTHISDKKVLKVKRLAKMKVPDVLREKHIAKPPVNLKIAIDLSEKRKQSCNKTKINANTVFEDPKGLVKSKVLNHDWKKGQVIFVSEKKLKTFQCKKNQKTSDWTAQEIEPRHALFEGKAKSYHLLKEFLEYDEVNFVCDVEE